MSQPTGPRPRLDVRGAVDLSTLNRPATPAPGQPRRAALAGRLRRGRRPDDVPRPGAELDAAPGGRRPVVAPERGQRHGRRRPGRRSPTRTRGRWLLARIDAEANPQIAQAFQAQSVPTVVAVLAGQPLPLFQGAYPRDQVRAVLDQVLAAAEANGITGPGRTERRRRPPTSRSPSRSSRRCTRRPTTRSSATTSRRRPPRTSRRSRRTRATPSRAPAWRRSVCSTGRATSTCRRPGRPLRRTRRTSTRSSRSRTSTSSAARSRTRSAGSSTSCARRSARTASGCACASSTCSRSSAARTPA